MATGGSTRTKKQKQDAFLEVYERNMGNASDACRAIGISKQAYHKWTVSDKAFVKRRDAINPYKLTEEALVSKLFEHIDNNNLTALIFTLKAKFGWIEGGSAPKEQNLKITIENADN